MFTFKGPYIYEALSLVMKYFPNNFTEEAKVEIETLLTHCIEGIADDSEKFLTALFIKAIRKYIGPTGIDEHIYLKKYEIPQIQLFNTLIEQFPFVKLSHEITNKIIVNYLQKNEKAVFIDIGIGQGVQTQRLIKELSKTTKLKELLIIGIEPFEDALQMAEVAINKWGKSTPFKLKFLPINALIEELKFEKLKETIAEYDGNVVINASLALHHIQTLDDRQTVLKTIHNLKPLALVLTEPNVDHYEPDFYRRFENCYKHFHGVFQVIDSLQIDQSDKNGLKLFFGREIEDIVGNKNNDERYEKHEPAFRWIERLNNIGFKFNQSFFEPFSPPPENIQIRMKANYIDFSHELESILAIIVAET